MVPQRGFKRGSKGPRCQITFFISPGKFPLPEKNMPRGWLGFRRRERRILGEEILHHTGACYKRGPTAGRQTDFS